MMYDQKKAESERSKILQDAMKAWRGDFGRRKTGKLCRKVEDFFNIALPINDFYGARSSRHNDLRHGVAKILDVDIDGRNPANEANAARVYDVVDSVWYYTLAIRQIAKAHSEFVWGFKWVSRCNSRRSGRFKCEKLDGKEWKLGDKKMPIPVRNTGTACNCMLFEVTQLEKKQRKKRSLVRRIIRL